MLIFESRRLVMFEKLDEIESYYDLKIRPKVWYEVLEIVKHSHISILDDFEQLLVIYENELIDAKFKDELDPDSDEDIYKYYLGINPYEKETLISYEKENLKNDQLDAVLFAEKLIKDSYVQSQLNVIDELLKDKNLEEVQKLWNILYKIK